MATEGGPNIVTDKLSLILDAANPKSYPGSGTTWEDLKGSNDMTLVNGTAFSSDNLGVFSFDGTNDYIFRNDTSGVEDWDINKTGEISIEYWIKYDQLVRSVDGGLAYGNLFGNSTNGDFQWQIGKHIVGSDFRITFAMQASSTTLNLQLTNNSNFTPPTPFVANKFYQFVFTYNYSSGAIKAHMDGINCGGDITGALTSPPVTPNVGRRFLTIGGRYNSIYSFLGDFAGLKIYNKELTEDEILQNYNALKHRFK